MTVHEGLHAACLVEGIELLEPIGSGGSGTVWRATWRERDVAVKILDDPSSRRPHQLSHPAILDVLGEGAALDRTYWILERFPTDLSQLLSGKPLRGDLRRPVLLQLLDALDYAHQRGVVHGDLKPANVLVDPAARPARVALADFGLPGPDLGELEASMLSVERGEQRGVSTLSYLAPERRAGEGPSVAADVYAFGVLLFEVLTGRLPLGLELPSELERGLDPRFDALVKQAMARDPGRRSPSVGPLRRELLRLLRGPAPAAGESVQPERNMVRIPGGFLVIGDRDDPQASPQHEVELAPYWIDRTPVTNRDYLVYVCATGARRPRTWPRSGRLPTRALALPVTGVSWVEARDYATWAGKRLPSELEWERAAQGPEQRSYPYGDSLDLTRIHTEPRRLRAVGTTPRGATSEGVHDLTGNGWEWTASPFVPYGVAAADTPSRTIRGGYDASLPRPASAHVRAGLRADARDPGVTFRCARD